MVQQRCNPVGLLHCLILVAGCVVPTQALTYIDGKPIAMAAKQHSRSDPAPERGWCGSGLEWCVRHSSWSPQLLDSWQVDASSTKILDKTALHEYCPRHYLTGLGMLQPRTVDPREPIFCHDFYS